MYYFPTPLSSAGLLGETGELVFSESPVRGHAFEGVMFLILLKNKLTIKTSRIYIPICGSS
mgnify:CR=1 FL=1